MSSYDIDISYHGPVFDGRAQHMVDRACHEWENSIAWRGAQLVDDRLNQVLKTQTPYYRLQVTVENYPGHSVVTDGGVIYGPWLEGTGSRNNTTRFKGYGTFRRVARELQTDARAMVQVEVRHLNDKINNA